MEQDKEKTILIVDDEVHIVQMLQMNMKTQGFSSIPAYSGSECLQIAASQPVDVILLDVMMPGIDGVETCRRLKAEVNTRHIPVIMVSAKSEEADKIHGLQSGADDYVTKPFNLQELFLRIRAVLRQVEVLTAMHTVYYEVGVLSLDTRKYLVLAYHERIDLTLTEFRILQMLMQQPEETLMRDLLAQEIFDKAPEKIGRTIDVHIRHIRKKLEHKGINSVQIQTVRGLGYKIVNTGLTDTRR